jgi:hypothetical protein
VASNGVKFITNFKKVFRLVEKYFEVKASADTSTGVNRRELALGSTLLLIGIADDVNQLTPELNPSAPRYLTRFFYSGFCSLNRSFL